MCLGQIEKNTTTGARSATWLRSLISLVKTYGGASFDEDSLASMPSTAEYDSEIKMQSAKKPKTQIWTAPQSKTPLFAHKENQKEYQKKNINKKIK